MKEQNFLALVYDLQSLEDISRSCLPRSTMTIITPLQETPENEALFKGFRKVIIVKDYLNSALVESLVVTHHQKHPFDALIALHEVDILRGGYLRDYLGLPGQDSQSAQAYRCKTQMKHILKKHNFLIPSFKSVQSAVDVLAFMDHHSYPVILKPDLGTGSRGVHIIDSKRQLYTLLKKKKVFAPNQPLDWQIEEFIPGQMYHINGIVVHNEVIASWPSHYPHQSIEMTQGRFASSILLSPENPLTQKLNDYAKKLIQVLPTPSHTVFHLEVFVTATNEIVFCEIASRIGGKGVRNSWFESFGVDLGKIFVESQALGNAYPKLDLPVLKPRVLTGEIWFPARQGTLKSVEKMCPYPWVKEYHVFFKAGDQINKAQDINSCVGGTPLFTGGSEKEMHHRLNEFVHWFTTHTRWQ